MNRYKVVEINGKCRSVIVYDKNSYKAAEAVKNVLRYPVRVYNCNRWDGEQSELVISSFSM